ncbi:MAG: multicopper oxidase type 3 [Thermomicrobiales bacterium]|nr:multicopper oxidase type 3 [Thermomicrobiales bacterium]
MARQFFPHRAAMRGPLGSVLVVMSITLLVAGGFVLAGVRPWSLVSTTEASAPEVREFTLTAQEINWEIMPGTTVRAWAYNGQMPGPEIRVREGDLVRITLHNELPAGTTIHWHGVNLPPEMDGPVGLNQAAVAPGEDFIYEFVATPAGTRWYHSHADPTAQIALGLYGSLIVEPREPSRTYDRDYTYILNEWDLELTPDVATGKAPRGVRDQILRGGELGTDLFLMNGHAHESIPPIKLAEGERVLVRLINAGNLPHAIHTHGHSFKVVATDGNDVPEGMVLVKDTVLIGPGERYDLELDGNNPGVWMFHCHMENHAANGMMSLIQYDGALPTGPVGAFFTPDGGVAAGAAEHMHGAPIAPTSEAAVAPDNDGPADVAGRSQTAAAEVEIAMVDDRFDPPELTVAAGTTLRFVNRGANWHSVAAFDGSFDSGRVDPESSFAVRLDIPGVYDIICKHHGLRGMVGRITVAE